MSQVIKAIRFVVAGALLAATTAAWSCSISMDPPAFAMDKDNKPVTWYECNKLFTAKITFSNWSEINSAAGVWLDVENLTTSHVDSFQMGFSRFPNTTSAEYTFNLNTRGFSQADYNFSARMYYYIEGTSYEAKSTPFQKPIHNGVHLKDASMTATVTSPTGTITAWGNNDFTVTSTHSAAWESYSAYLDGAITASMKGAHGTNWCPATINPPYYDYTLRYSNSVSAGIENGIGTHTSNLEAWATNHTTCQWGRFGGFSAGATTYGYTYNGNQQIEYGEQSATPINWSIYPPE